MERRGGRKRLAKVLLFVRWAIIAGCFAFVAWGWVRSAMKYASGKTSISIAVNESDKFTYPSVTFCPGFKGGADLKQVIAVQAD